MKQIWALSTVALLTGNRWNDGLRTDRLRRLGCLLLIYSGPSNQRALCASNSMQRKYIYMARRLKLSHTCNTWPPNLCTPAPLRCTTNVITLSLASLLAQYFLWTALLVTASWWLCFFNPRIFWLLWCSMSPKSICSHCWIFITDFGSKTVRLTVLEPLTGCQRQTKFIWFIHCAGPQINRIIRGDREVFATDLNQSRDGSQRCHLLS